MPVDGARLVSSKSQFQQAEPARCKFPAHSPSTATDG